MTTVPRGERKDGAAAYLEYVVQGALLLVWGVPLALVVGGAFFQLDFSAPETLWSWAGLDHFVGLLSGGQLWWALARTLLLAATSIVASFGLAALIGWALVGLPRALARAVVGACSVPLFLPPITTALIWYFQFSPQYGPLGHAFYQAFGLSALASGLAFWAVALVQVWTLTPFFVLFFYMSQVSFEPSLRDTLRIHQVKTSPGLIAILALKLRPTLAVFLALGLAMSLRSFEAVAIITGGGPGTETETAPALIYRLSLQRFELGRAAAASILYDVAFTVLFIVLWRRLLREQP